MVCVPQIVDGFATYYFFCVRIPLALRTSSALSLYHPKETHKSVCSRLALCHVIDHTLVACLEGRPSWPEPWPSGSAQGSIDHNQLHREVDHLPANRIVVGHVATKTYRWQRWHHVGLSENVVKPCKSFFKPRKGHLIWSMIIDDNRPSKFWGIRQTPQKGTSQMSLEDGFSEDDSQQWLWDASRNWVCCNVHIHNT